MTSVEIVGEHLVVRVLGLDRLWSFKREVRVPLRHVAGAEPAADQARRWWLGLRAPGTHIPGVITAGTFHGRAGAVFWDVHDPKGAIAIRLRNERYVELIVEVEDPAAAVAAIEAARAPFAGTEGG